MIGVVPWAVLLAVASAVPAPAAGPRVILSTWLGGPGADALTSAIIMLDGASLVGGTVAVDQLKLLQPPRAIAGSGDGAIIRISPTENEILAIVRFIGAVADLDIDADGSNYITGGFGTTRISVRGQLVWTNSVGDKDSRVAAGPGGGAFVIAGNKLIPINSRGHADEAWDIPGASLNDVAWDPQTRRVFVTGFVNKKGHKENVQVAFVYAYEANGKQAWKAYGWSGVEVDDEGLRADTRGYRLAMGPADRKLYLAGESAGGNSIWTRQSQDLKAKADLAKGDRYQQASNTAANPITFIGRLDAMTGKSEGGTMLLGRLPDDKASTMRPRALAVDGDGRIYVGGTAASGAPISEGAFGGRSEGGAFLVIFDASFKRVYATTLCDGQTNAIAVAPSYVVAVGEGKGGLVAERPLQAQPGGDTDGWVVMLMRMGRMVPYLPLPPPAKPPASPAPGPAAPAKPPAAPAPAPGPAAPAKPPAAPTPTPAPAAPAPGR
jgi:hypothetical protein